MFRIRQFEDVRKRRTMASSVSHWQQRSMSQLVRNERNSLSRDGRKLRTVLAQFPAIAAELNALHTPNYP
jgi:hypothetical protein